MKEIGAFEAKNTLGGLLDRVERGEEIVITRHGKRIARLVPNVEGTNRSAAEAAAQRIRSRAKTVKLAPLEWNRLKAERDKGRP